MQKYADPLPRETQMQVARFTKFGNCLKYGLLNAIFDKPASFL
jgi:hypothetical protein